MTPQQRQAVIDLMRKQQRAIIAIKTRIDRGNSTQQAMEQTQARHRMEMVVLVNNLMTQPTCAN